MFSKKCLVCDKEFVKKVNCSRKKWKFVTKYCSRKCKGQSSKGIIYSTKGLFKKGMKPWNTGTRLAPQISGKNHQNWKGGRLKRQSGYIEILCHNHPCSNSMGYVKEHRLIMEKHLGRYLEPQEVIHHINEIKDDNRLENLMLFPNNGAHTSYHLRNLN